METAHQESKAAYLREVSEIELALVEGRGWRQPHAPVVVVGANPNGPKEFEWFTPIRWAP